MKQIYSLKELQEESEAFAIFRRVEDCNIPDYYKEIFPHKCLCGADMIMTEPGHTQLQCCNPSCWVKMAYRLSNFISSLGYKDFGEGSAYTLMQAVHQELPYNTFLSIFLLPESTLGQALNDYYLGIFLGIKESLYTSSFQFRDAIAALGVPGIGQRSNFFDVVRGPMVLLQYTLQDDTDTLCDAAGIQAPMTRFWLRAFKTDILTLMKDVMPNIQDTPRFEVCVAITGRVSVQGESLTRQEFISKCESILDGAGVKCFDLVETKDKSKLEYVIADGPSTSSKYTIGRELGILITAEDFYAKLVQKAESLNATPNKSTHEESAPNG